MMTSRLLDTIGVSSVPCLRFFSELAGLGVPEVSGSKGLPQGVTAVGVLGCCFSVGVGAALASATPFTCSTYTCSTTAARGNRVGYGCWDGTFSDTRVVDGQ